MTAKREMSEADETKGLRGLQFLCRHLLGLCVTYRDVTEDGLPSRFATCSGTLLFIENNLYFLTAGHVLEALGELRDHDSVQIEHAALADVFGLQPTSSTPIPFDLKTAQLCFIDDQSLGLDFGIIPIAPHHARLLSKNGMIALAEENWLSQYQVQFDAYFLLGFPAEWVSERVSPSSTVTIQPTMFAVERLNSTIGAPPSAYPRFIGRISPDLPLDSLEGMSGGLILGVKLEASPRYWVVAIQSSWNRGTRTIYGCSLPIIGSLLTSSARSHASVVRQIDENTAVFDGTKLLEFRDVDQFQPTTARD